MAGRAAAVFSSLLASRRHPPRTVASVPTELTMTTQALVSTPSNRSRVSTPVTSGITTAADMLFGALSPDYELQALEAR